MFHIINEVFNQIHVRCTLVIFNLLNTLVRLSDIVKYRSHIITF